MKKVSVGFDPEKMECYCRECLSKVLLDEKYCPCCGNKLDWGEF